MRRRYDFKLFIQQIENDPQEFALYCVHQSGGTSYLLYQSHTVKSSLTQH